MNQRHPADLTAPPMIRYAAEPTITLRLHALAPDSPILPEQFGKLPVAINGKAYMATITKIIRAGEFVEIDMWMKPEVQPEVQPDKLDVTTFGAAGGPDGPVLITRDELYLADLG